MTPIPAPGRSAAANLPKALRMAPLCLLAAGLILAGCSTARKTHPERTATEELLISKAADAAAERLSLPIPRGAKVHIEAANFEDPDGKYAVGAIRDRLLQDGARLARDKDDADVLVAIRSGALSIDDSESVLGIPEFDLPIPLAGTFTFPGLAVYSDKERKGVAKFVATATDNRDGRLIGTTGPQFGYSHKRRFTVLFFFSHSSDDLIPDDQRDQDR
ncbi:MAG: hypothetical protein RIB84_09435 [Sneathiellaceae bacterium]